MPSPFGINRSRRNAKHLIPASISRNLDDYFPEVAALVYILQGIPRLFRLELAIDDKVGLLLSIQTQHLLEAVLGSIQDTLERDIPRERKHVGIDPATRGVFLARQVTDGADEAAKRDTLEQL